MPARIVVFAYSDVGHACLQLLLQRGENVVAVYTHADNPNEKIWFPSVLKLARAHSVPVVIDADLKLESDFAALEKTKPELILSFYYRNMIPASVLKLPRLGAYNMHGSHLPKFRGRAPVNWAVLKGETETGATLHEMVEKPDAGDIIDQQKVPIGPDDTTAVVQARVTEAAVYVLARQIDNLKQGKAPRQTQDASKASYFGKRTPEDGVFEWTWPAKKIHDLVRAVSKPYPGAVTSIDGVRTVVWKTRLTGKKAAAEEIGHLRRVDGTLLVTCGDGFELEILELDTKL